MNPREKEKRESELKEKEAKSLNNFGYDSLKQDK
jgi:hypothetical protein